MPFDPVIYGNCHLLLEKIFGLYTTYEKLYLEKLLSMKDDKIDRITKQNDEQKKLILDQTARIDKQSAEIQMLLGYAKTTSDTLDETKSTLNETKENLIETKTTLYEVQDDLEETRATLQDVQEDYEDAREELVEIQDEFEETRETLAEVHTELIETREIAVTAKTFLEEKCFLSTMNPSDESKHHYFVAIMVRQNDRSAVKFVTGQRAHVDKTIEARHAEGHSVLIESFFNTNGIDLRHNACEEFRARRDATIQQVNEARAEADRVANAELRREITAHNRTCARDNRRVYMNEKRRTPRIGKRDIPVRFTKLSFTYTKNEFMSFEEARNIVTRTNEVTQSSPLAP